MKPLSELQDRFALHVAQEIGPVHGIIELNGASMPLALLHVPATDTKPFQVLISAGLSARAMDVPPEFEEEAPHRLELMLGLPRDWPIQSPSPDHGWPMRLLADTARFVADGGGWLMEGHTLPNGDPMRPYHPSTQMACALVAPPLSLRDEAKTGPQGTSILALVPLFPSEVQLKLNEGVDQLLSRLDDHQVSEVLFPGRRAVAGTLLDLLDGRSSS